mgnify:CR=1 FL=1
MGQLLQVKGKTAAVKADEAPSQYLTFTLGGEMFAVGILNVKEIIEGVRLGASHVDIHHQFHHVFWMGDLNYRLATRCVHFATDLSDAVLYFCCVLLLLASIMTVWTMETKVMKKHPGILLVLFILLLNTEQSERKGESENEFKFNLFVGVVPPTPSWLTR